MTNNEINNIPHYTESIFYELKQTARIMQLYAYQLFESLSIKISPEEYATLDTIMCNHEMCQRDVAKLLLKDRANTGRILEKLEERGLIKRTVDTKNNRLVKKCIITDEGIRALEETNSAILNNLKNVTKSASPEYIENIKLSLEKFRKNLEEKIENKI